MGNDRATYGRNGTGDKRDVSIVGLQQAGESRLPANAGSGAIAGGGGETHQGGSGNPPQGVGASADAGGEAAAAGGDKFNPLAALQARLSKGAESPYGLDSDPLSKRCPALWCLLTRRVGLRGRKKQTATLRVEAIATGFRATLSDLTLSVALTADSETFDALAEALEHSIRDPKATWRELRHGERAQAVKQQNSKNPVDWET